MAVLALLGTPSFAAMDAMKVSTMQVEVDQDVLVSAVGSVSTLEVRLMVPQEDAFQKVSAREASLPYETVTDDYGNRMLKFTIANPGQTAKISVKSTVSISRRNAAGLPALPILSQPTNLIESTDREITDLATYTTEGETGDFEKTAAVAAWVNENIRYDIAYADANLSAKTTLKQRAGVCDELSALTMAMLRGIGYRTGYIVGYAYGRGYRIAENFVAHGWVEACSPGGKCYPVDPTWGEAGWLDATHVKFATLPETYYVEASASAKGQGAISIKLESVNTRITILSSAESPLIKTTATLLDDKVWEGYAVLKADLTMDGCAMSKAVYAGCTREDGSPFLSPDKNETVLYFCGKKTVFMPFRIPDEAKESTVYGCPLAVVTAAGERGDVEVTIDPREKDAEKVALVVDRTAVKPGEAVNATARGAYLFTSNGLYGQEDLLITAPAKDFIIYAYRNGQLALQSVSVAESRPIELKLTVPESVKAGEPFNASVEVKNIDTKDRTVGVRIGTESKGGMLAAGKGVVYSFTLTAAEGEIAVQAFAESDGFSTSTSSGLSVTMPEKGIIDQIIDAIMDFINGMFGVA